MKPIRSILHIINDVESSELCQGCIAELVEVAKLMYEALQEDSSLAEVQE